MLNNKRKCVIHEIIKNKHFGAKIFCRDYQVARENLFFACGSCGQSLIRKVMK